jgi:F0F1-type ATP synthase membrane subunit a
VNYQHAEMARKMIGHSLADALNLPRAPWFRPLAAFLFFLVFLLNVLRAPFVYPDSWLERTSRRKFAEMTDKILKESGSKMRLYCMPPKETSERPKTL